MFALSSANRIPPKASLSPVTSERLIRDRAAIPSAQQLVRELIFAGAGEPPPNRRAKQFAGGSGQFHRNAHPLRSVSAANAS